MKTPTEVTDLRAKLAKVITLDVAKDGTATHGGLDKVLSTAFTPEELKNDEDVMSKRSTLFTAFAGAVGDVGIAAMKKHPNLKVVEAVLPLTGKDTFTVTVDREKSYPKPGKPGETIKAFGVLNTQLDTVSSRSNRGLMKQVRQELQEKALAAFGS
jgi:hypothetical protein